ncbi:hypothetical protein D8674_001765 [Pyrus ussuriensis x Pyrus communis]|uniref:Uncharacterized protein n=1 Tax=Pyrus ussuriensis x Pyrus communis TaxID=2448454 RepID=A0A5N5F739_9ROSA|nr:hypothetical protein D8674_001765 [Pyrus ussuriensis x Pyrus communis]
MIRVGIVAELLGLYTAALARMAEELVPARRHNTSFRDLVNNLRLASRPASTHDAASSFYLYF